MGTDQLFHKRKQRLAESFKRKTEWREQNKVALVVCQGRRSEPNYLRGLQRALRMPNANLVIIETGEGRDSVSVVRAGIAAYEKDANAYDKVFCVFDRDNDPHYAKALQIARTHELAKRGLLVGINSAPCFELWLLLHYDYTTREFVRTGDKSACDNVIAELSKNGRIPGYVKNHKGIYDIVAGKTEAAITNARLLAKYNASTRSPDASQTKMHELVAYLRSIAPN
jgi:hypothetical protein